MPPPTRVDDQTFTVSPGAEGARLNVAAAATCADGTPKRSVRLVILPDFAKAAGPLPAAAALFIEPGGTGQEQFQLVFDGMVILSQAAQKKWGVQPLNFSASRGAWATAYLGGSVAYRFEGSVDALPTDLQVSLTPAGVTPADLVLDANGQSLTTTQLTFKKWRFQELAQLNPVIQVSDTATGTLNVLVPLPRPLLLMTQTPPAAPGGAPCPAGFNCQPPTSVGMAPLSLLLQAAWLTPTVRFSFGLPDDRVYVGHTEQATLTVDVKKDVCRYEVIPLKPLYAGFRDTKLYLQIVGYKNNGMDPLCVKQESWIADPRSWRKWLVHVEGLQVNAGQSLNLVGSSQDGAPFAVVELPITKVLADAGGKATLRLTYSDNSDVNLQQGSFPIQLAVSSPPTFTGPVRFEVREPHSRRGSARWQDWERVGAGFKDLAVDRNNLLFFEAEDLEAWQLRSLSLHVKPCAGDVWGPKNGQLLKGSEGVFCVVPQRETDDGFSFQAVYKPAVGKLLPGLTDLKDNHLLDLGYLEFKTALRSKPLRTALNLHERTSVRCENTRAGVAERSITSLAPEYQPNAVVASAYSGPRAVPAEDLDHCKVIISLRRNSIGEASEDKGPLELRTEALELLQTVGEQSLTITADILPKEQGKDKTNLFTKSLKLWNRDDLEVVNGTVEVPILLRKGGSIQLEDYSVVRVTVTHAREDGYVVGDDSFPTSRMEADLRRMPEYFAGRIVRGVGPRAFFTIEIPTGLVRWPGAGFEETSSTAHRRLEAAVFGIGALAVLEAYDFDNAKQFLSFNPQLHAGVLLSTVPRAGIPPPRLSLVTGVGVRFPSSIKLPASIESGLASVFWVEWGNRARDNWAPAFLFGFSVNVGSFPN